MEGRKRKGRDACNQVPKSGGKGASHKEERRCVRNERRGLQRESRAIREASGKAQE